MPSATAGQYVLDVVRALERDLSHRHDGLLACWLAPDDAVVAHECPVLNFVLTAEPVHGALVFVGHRDAGGVVGVQYGEVVARLILEDARLGRGVVLKRVMAVEMVGRDVQHHGDLRGETSRWSPAESC